MVEAKSHRPYASRGGGRPPSWITLLIILLATSSLTHGRTRIEILEDIVKIMGDIKLDLETLQNKTLTTTPAPSTSTAGNSTTDTTTTSGAGTTTTGTTTTSDAGTSTNGITTTSDAGTSTNGTTTTSDAGTSTNGATTTSDAGTTTTGTTTTSDAGTSTNGTTTTSGAGTTTTSTTTTSDAGNSTTNTTTTSGAVSKVLRSKRSLERGVRAGAVCPQLQVVNDTMDVVESVSSEVDSGIVVERQVDELTVAESNLSAVVLSPEPCLMQELGDNPDLIAGYLEVMNDVIDGVTEALEDVEKEEKEKLAIIIGCSVGATVLLIIIVSVSVYCVKKKKNTTPAKKQGGKTTNKVSEVQEARHAAKKDDKIPLQQSQYGEEKEGIKNPLMDEPIRAPLTAANTFTTFPPPSQAADHGTGGWLDQHPLPNNNNNVQQHSVPVTPLRQPHQQQQQQQPPQKYPNQIQPVLLGHPVQPLPVHSFRNAPLNEAPRIESGAQHRPPPENKFPMSESNLINRAQGPPVHYRQPYRSDYEDEDEKLGRTEVRTLGGSFVPVNRTDQRNAGRSRGQRPRPPHRSRSHFSDDEYRSPRASRYSRQDVRSNRARPQSFSPNSRPKSSRNYSDSDSPRYERPQSRPRAKIPNSADERKPVNAPGRIPRLSPPPVARKPYQNPDVRRPGSRPATRPAPRPTSRPYERDNSPQKKREEIADVKKDVAQRKDFRRPYSYADLY